MEEIRAIALSLQCFNALLMIRYFTLIVGVVTGMLCSFLSTAQENEETSLF